MHPAKDTRHSFYETFSEYGGIRQKWVLVHSKEMQARKEKTFETSLEKLDVQTAKSFKKLLGLEFACENDARAAAEHWAKNHPWYLFTGFTTAPVSRKVEGKRGRPRNDEERLIVYTIQAELGRNTEVIHAEKEKLGRFILASNDLSLDPETMLDYYKNQSAVEKGFRFLKDKSFRISEVYLKKPERIEALFWFFVASVFSTDKKSREKRGGHPSRVTGPWRDGLNPFCVTSGENS